MGPLLRSLYYIGASFFGIPSIEMEDPKKDGWNFHLIYLEDGILASTRKDLKMNKRQSPASHKIDGEIFNVENHLVSFYPSGAPRPLLNGGEHFDDCVRGRRPMDQRKKNIPREKLMTIIEEGQYKRPPTKN